MGPTYFLLRMSSCLPLDLNVSALKISCNILRVGSIKNFLIQFVARLSSIIIFNNLDQTLAEMSYNWLT